jgi:hypothetical protein
MGILYHSMSESSPLDYESKVRDPAERLPPRVLPQIRPPAYAHRFACLACLVVFWGNVATLCLESEARDELRHYDGLRILWTLLAVVGIAFGVQATRFSDDRRWIGRLALVTNACLLALMWAWRLGIFNLFALAT